MKRPINRREFLKSATAWGIAGGALGSMTFTAKGSTDSLFLRTGTNMPGVISGNPVIEFGLIADTHYGDRPDTRRPRFFRWSLPNVRQLITQYNQWPLDFVVHLGDVIQEAGDRDDTLALLVAMDEELTKSTAPLHYVPGNHDLGDNSKTDFLDHTSGAVAAMRYYFDVEGYRFIILDAGFRSNGVEYDSGNFSWRDAFVPPAEMAWLEDTLDDALAENLRAIVFTHQNLERPAVDHRISNADAVLALLGSKGNVDMVMSGHRHAGGYDYVNGIHIVTMVATVNGPDPAGGRVKIYEDGTIEVVGVGQRQPSWGPFQLISTP